MRLRNNPIHHWFESVGHNFCDDLVGDVTQGNWAQINHTLRAFFFFFGIKFKFVLFWDGANNPVEKKNCWTSSTTSYFTNSQPFWKNTGVNPSGWGLLSGCIWKTARRTSSSILGLNKSLFCSSVTLSEIQSRTSCQGARCRE